MHPAFRIQIWRNNVEVVGNSAPETAALIRRHVVELRGIPSVRTIMALETDRGIATVIRENVFMVLPMILSWWWATYQYEFKQRSRSVEMIILGKNYVR